MCLETVYRYVHTLRAHMPLHMSIHKVEDAMKTCPADHVAYIKFLMDYGTHFTNKVV